MNGRLLDLKARQPVGEKMPCPRYGRMSMKVPQENNILNQICRPEYL